MPGTRVPHALLNPASEPLYSQVARLIVDALKHAYRVAPKPELAAVINIDDATAIRLAGDAFSTFYVSWPIVRRHKIDNVVIETLRRALQYLVATPEFQRLQALTRYSVAKSLVYGMRLVIDVLRELAKRGIIDYGNVQQNVSEQLIERVARAVASNARKSCRCRQLAALAQELEELQRLLQQGQQRQRGLAPSQQPQQQQQQHVAMMVGGREAGKQPGTLATIAKIAALAVNNADLQQIIILGGQIEAKFRFLRSARRESRCGTVDGYTLTSKPEKALPREHVLPDELWYAKLANGRWLTKRRVEEKLGMLIMALDKSGSMMGKKTIWSRSIAYALTKLALKRRQPVALLFFDFVPHGPFTDPATILEMLLSVPSDGGTSIDRALAAALELLEQHKDKTNTIVLITDGEDEVRTPAEELKRRSARLVAVMVKGNNPDLERLAKASGGQYLRAQLDEKGALRVVDAAL